MKKFFLAVCILISAQVSAYPLTFLEMNSESGDYIGAGKNYYFTEDDGSFRAKQSYWGNSTYRNNSVSLGFSSYDGLNWWYLDFSTHELGRDLIEGTYNAVRFPFEPAGSAGMSIFGNGRGSNTLIGVFTILDIDFGLNGAINRFAATFEQHSEGRSPALFGAISYNSEAFFVDEPSIILIFLIGLVCILISRKKQ